MIIKLYAAYYFLVFNPFNKHTLFPVCQIFWLHIREWESRLDLSHSISEFNHSPDILLIHYAHT